jgi:hypothetical protein
VVAEKMSFSKFIRDVKARKGASYNIVTDDYNPSTGYMVSLKGSESKSAMTDDERELLKRISAYVEEHVDLLAEDGRYLGAWVVNESPYVRWKKIDILYLDVSVNIANLDEALAFAEANGQQAIYDCSMGESIYLQPSQQS